MTAIVGRDPVTGRTRTVSVHDGAITGITDGGEDDGSFLCPGLLDLQVNGFGGHDLNADPTPATVHALVRAVAASGVSRFAPTLVTAARPALLAALRTIAEARRTDPLTHHAIPFIHVEGPHLSPDDGPRGAHPKQHIRPPDLDEFDAWQAACNGLVRLVTLSPHWPGAPAYIAGLRHRGTHTAIGHTMAPPEAIHAAVDAGARLSTHLGNGIAATLPRHPNPIWTQLADDRLHATFIADGHHLPPETLRAMARAKGLSRSILVSDATALAGQPPGRYDAAIGGQVELDGNGRLGLVGTPYLAGAARPLLACVATAMHDAGLTLPEALGCASTVPAALFGLPALAVGAPAHLLRFHRHACGALCPVETIVAGHSISP